MNFIIVLDTTLAMIAKIGAIMIFSPIYVFPAILMGALGSLIGKMYIKATMSVKREMSNAKAPVLGAFGGAMAGLSMLCPLSLNADAYTITFSIHPRLRGSEYVPETD